MRILPLLFLLPGCLHPIHSEDGPLQDGERYVEGRVTAIDLEPLSYDGDGRILVEQGDGTTVSVFVPARSNLCQSRDLGDVGDMQAGDAIEARGTVVRGGVLPCASPDHFFRVTD